MNIDAIHQKFREKNIPITLSNLLYSVVTVSNEFKAQAAISVRIDNFIKSEIIKSAAEHIGSKIEIQTIDNQDGTKDLEAFLFVFTPDELINYIQSILPNVNKDAPPPRVTGDIGKPKRRP